MQPSQQAIAGLQSPEPGYLAADIGRVLCEQAKLGTTWGEDDDPIRRDDAKRAPSRVGCNVVGAQAVASAADVHRCRVRVPHCCLRACPSRRRRRRAALFQGLVTGISAAIGYGLGVVGAWVWREFANRQAREPRRKAWRAFALSAPIALSWLDRTGTVVAGATTGPDGRAKAGPSFVLLPLTAALVFVLVIAAGRVAAGVYRRVTALLGRWIGPRPARAMSMIVVALGAWLFISGVLLDGLVWAADQAFAVRNDTTEDGVQEPTRLRSGGPGSLVPWESLGRQGRPSLPAERRWRKSERSPAPRRSSRSGSSRERPRRRTPKSEPSSPCATWTAGGFDRSYLLVVTTTGSGQVAPDSVSAFEYLTAGDSAIVAIQYSYLPSWLSYAVDQERARGRSRTLRRGIRTVVGVTGR